MEQPEAATPVVTVVIQWLPAKGQFAVQWPQIDDVVKLGLLSMAASTLSETRIKNGLSGNSQLVVPARAMPS